jgi:hypothetical protein
MPADSGQREVRQLVAQRSGQPLPDVPPASLEQHIAALLAKPLSVESAVDIAMLNNRSLRAAYAELGIAEADLVQAGRIANPIFSFGRLKGAHGVEFERQRERHRQQADHREHQLALDLDPVRTFEAAE